MVWTWDQAANRGALTLSGGIRQSVKMMTIMIHGWTCVFIFCCNRFDNTIILSICTVRYINDMIRKGLERDLEV